jgi:DNA repair protein RadC
MKAFREVAEISVSYTPAVANKPIITTSLDAYNVLKEYFPPDTIELQERFVVLYLNRRNKAFGAFLVSLGGLTSTIADVRLILSVALKIAATSIILAHNHPSGSLKPSVADEELTQKISEAGKFMDIKVMDHIIMTSEQYLSFADEGLL